MKQQTQLEFINFASVCSALSVVFLHANNCFWHFNSTARYWKTANIIECLFYFAVPVFFMISGATLIDYNKRYNLKTYFSKRINKTFIPYIVWSFLGLLFQVIYIKSIPLSKISPKFLLNGLFTGTLVRVYWFFIPLFCIYLSIPLISEIPEQKRKKTFTYIIIIQFVFGALIPFINSVFNLKIQYSFLELVIAI
jgi:surface polysaccharide O-acyltransferase-like enzyme